MERERWQQLEDLYHAALKFEPGKQAGFVRVQCGEDESLRCALDSLLRQPVSVDSVFDHPAFEAAAKSLSDRGPESARDPLIHSMVANFRILERLGGGGMGVVYKAFDLKLRREVALKFLPTEMTSDPQAVSRFRREAQAASALNHPNICIIYETGRHEGKLFFVMEYLDGPTLKDHILGRALETDEISRLGIQIAEALSAAHSKGVVHRDIKPGNMIVRPGGVVKVLDFGLAKLIGMQGGSAPTQSLTETHAVAGTLPYMSPEQLRGRAVDARTDIYALGTVLYEMATGQLPFATKTSAQLIDDILNNPPPLPRSVNSRVMPKLEEIIVKCLEKDPEDRYQTVREIAVDLRRMTMPSPAPPRLVASPRRFVKTSRFIWTAIAVLLLASVGALWRFNASRHIGTTMRSIAVLPLENLSADPDQEYFADGMTDELITNLAQIHSLRVISRTSVMQFKHTKKSLPEIAAALNVDACVVGSVARTGTNVRITAQLLDARGDRHLWAASYDRQIADILGLRAQVAKAIADQVKAKLTPEEDARLSKQSPRDPEAYDALLKGRFLRSIRNRDTGRLKKALAYFQQAATSDPSNAEAWARIGDCYASLEEYGTEDPKVTRPKARAAIARALELDPDLAVAYIASGWLKMFDWDEAGAERDFQRAIELSPNNSEAHRRYAFYLRHRGRYEMALEENKRALELAPLDIMPQIHLALIYESAGLADKEIEQSKRVLELDPNYTTAYLRLGNAYAMKGQWSQAIEAYDNVKKTPDKVGYLSGVAWIWAASGNMYQAKKAMAELKELSEHSYISPLLFAAYEARFGDHDQAFYWLEKAYQLRQLELINLDTNHDFDKLRSVPRFQDFMHRVFATAKLEAASRFLPAVSEQCAWLTRALIFRA